MFLMYCSNECDICSLVRSLFMPHLQSVPMGKVISATTLDCHYFHTSAHISPPAVICFVITMCWWVIGLLPVVVLCGRYFYSRRVIHGYLEHAMRRDMEDIEGFYMKSSGKYRRIHIPSAVCTENISMVHIVELRYPS